MLLNWFWFIYWKHSCASNWYQTHTKIKNIFIQILIFRTHKKLPCFGFFRKLENYLKVWHLAVKSGLISQYKFAIYINFLLALLIGLCEQAKPAGKFSQTRRSLHRTSSKQKKVALVFCSIPLLLLWSCWLFYIPGGSEQFQTKNKRPHRLKKKHLLLSTKSRKAVHFLSTTQFLLVQVRKVFVSSIIQQK